MKNLKIYFFLKLFLQLYNNYFHHLRYVEIFKCLSFKNFKLKFFTFLQLNMVRWLSESKDVKLPKEKIQNIFNIFVLS